MPFHMMYMVVSILFIATCFPAVPNAAFHILSVPCWNKYHSQSAKLENSNGRLYHHVSMMEKKSSSRISHKAQVDDSDGEVTKLRDEIEQMKKEAMEKLDNLEKASFTAVSAGTSEKTPIISSDSQDEETATATLLFESEDEAKGLGNDIDKYVDKLAVSNIPRASTVKYRDELSLLDDSKWKISLSIGRERGMC